MFLQCRLQQSCTLSSKLSKCLILHSHALNPKLHLCSSHRVPQVIGGATIFRVQEGWQNFLKPTAFCCLCCWWVLQKDSSCLGRPSHAKGQAQVQQHLGRNWTESTDEIRRAVHSCRAKRVYSANAESHNTVQLSYLQQLRRHCVTWQGSWQNWQAWGLGKGACGTCVPRTGQRS